MKLIKKTLPTSGGAEVTVSVGTLEDLWQLYNLVIVGDIISSFTLRKVTIGSKTEKMKLKLKICVTDVHLDPLGEIRFGGTVLNENEYVRLHSRHTISFSSDPRDTRELTFIKSEWNTALDERLKEACDITAVMDTAAVLMDYGIAHVCLISSSMIVTIASVNTSIAKKHKANGSSRDESIQKFFHQVYEAVTQINFDTVKAVLLCSPGTLREEFFKYMQQQSAQNTVPGSETIRKHLSCFILVKVSTAFKGALREAYNNPTVAKRIDLTKGMEGVKVWEEFQQLLTEHEERCVYTAQYVTEAVTLEAVEKLLISDKLFRAEKIFHRQFYNGLCEKARQYGATVVTLSSEHVSGAQLDKMGGVAAILRYGVPELDEIEPDENFLQSNRAQTLIMEYHKKQEEEQQQREQQQ